MKKLAMLLAAVFAMQIPAAQNIDVHDPEIIKSGDYYYVFSTGRRGSLLQSVRSKNLIDWSPAGQVFGELPDWVRESVPGCRGFWAPAVAQVDGKFYLYYSASTFGRQTSAIGLTVSSTLDHTAPDYGWEDRGLVVSSDPSKDFNAIDPCIIKTPEDRMYLAFGSFWGGIKMTELNLETGKPLFEDDPEFKTIATRATDNNAIEAPYIIRKGDYYYLFVSFDRCCIGIASTYKIMAGRSKNVDGPYVDRGGKLMTEGGGTLILEGGERFKGTGHNSVLLTDAGDYLVYHTYDAERRGRPTLQIRKLTWTEDLWPEAGEVVSDPRKSDPTDNEMSCRK
jgi:arabinan endo-1,5-alpha-L-arabinosidase